MAYGSYPGQRLVDSADLSEVTRDVFQLEPRALVMERVPEERVPLLEQFLPREEQGVAAAPLLVPCLEEQPVEKRSAST